MALSLTLPSSNLKPPNNYYNASPSKKLRLTKKMLGTGKSAWKGFSVDQGILVDRNISRGKPQELTVAIGFNW